MESSLMRYSLLFCLSNASRDVERTRTFTFWHLPFIKYVTSSFPLFITSLLLYDDNMLNHWNFWFACRYLLWSQGFSKILPLSSHRPGMCQVCWPSSIFKSYRHFMMIISVATGGLKQLYKLHSAVEMSHDIWSHCTFILLPFVCIFDVDFNNVFVLYISGF